LIAATSAPPGWRVWVLAARPATLPAAVVPVLVGTAAALNEGAAARVGPTRVTQSGLVAPSAVLSATLLTFALAALIGLYLVAVGGWPILVVGLLSILSGMAYTGGPWPLGYHGLGELFVFVFFGVVAVTGSAYLQTGNVAPVALFASVPIGLLVTAILVVNNLRDVETDRAAGKRTLAVRLGRPATRRQYALLVLGAYVAPLLLWLSGPLGRPIWLPWLSLPLGLALVRLVLSGVEGGLLNLVLKRTGQLHLLFGCLFALALAWPVVFA
jgi:1,4-dihydroxy-2-naphthoate octaprenyltransferase